MLKHGKLLLLLTLSFILVSGCSKVVTHDLNLAQEIAVNTIIDLYFDKEYEAVYNSFHSDLQANTSVQQLQEGVVYTESNFGILELVEVVTVQPNSEGVVVFIKSHFIGTDKKAGKEIHLVGCARDGYQVSAMLGWGD